MFCLSLPAQPLLRAQRKNRAFITDFSIACILTTEPDKYVFLKYTQITLPLQLCRTTWALSPTEQPQRSTGALLAGTEGLERR